jgi:hypothetical protein
VAASVAPTPVVAGLAVVVPLVLALAPAARESRRDVASVLRVE